MMRYLGVAEEFIRCKYGAVMFDDNHKDNLVEHGFCVVPGVLDNAGVADVRQRLVQASAESQRRGVPAWIEGLDPNDSNERVFNLLDLDPVFVDLIDHKLANELVSHALGDSFIISNFTANIAKPGSQSMVVHSDLSVVMPEPWQATWSVNVMWCLDDMYRENGATLYLPGSHHIEKRSELPADPLEHMVPLQASAGSVILMDGRLWHTSGTNTTKDQERALLFGYYTQPFIRPQWNFSVGLSDAVKANLSDVMRTRLGLTISANVRPLTGVK